MAEPDDPEMRTLEKRELELKIGDLWQKRTLEVWKVVLTALGVGVVILGWMLDRYRVVDQRQWEGDTEARRARVTRMTEIASSFDQLYGTTLEALHKSVARAVVLKAHLEALRSKVKETKGVAPEEAKNLTATIDSAINDLSRADIAYAEYVEVVSLQDRWAVREAALTPDFRLFFGDELAAQWPTVAQSGRDALNAQFNPAAGQPAGPAIDSYRREGNAFQTKMREEINKQNRPGAERGGMLVWMLFFLVGLGVGLSPCLVKRLRARDRRC